jgi:hypothetical protein
MPAAEISAAGITFRQLRRGSRVETADLFCDEPVAGAA